jgi:hypothetical protein
MACPSCSISEHKTISLCLNCYGPFHDNLRSPQVDPLVVAAEAKW